MPPTLLVPGSLRGHPDVVPVDFITKWLKKRMPEFGGQTPITLADRVIIAKSETGSGKSTVLPAHVFQLLRNPRASAQKKYTGRSVLCTQPRVLTAMVLARDMASSPHYSGLALPDLTKTPGGRKVTLSPGTVGFQTGPITNKPPQGLVYATAGVLLAQLRAATATGDFSEITGRYAFIIIDEAHEQSLDIDSVLMLLKQLLLAGIAVGGEAARQLPFVILASATINVETYARFFGLCPASGPSDCDNIFRIVGRQHGIETHWPKTGTNDYLAEAVRVTAQIHNERPDDPSDQRDILIFLPGAGEMRKAATTLEKMQERGKLDAGGPALILLINREVINDELPAFALVKAPTEALWGALESRETYSNNALQEFKEKGLTPRRIIIATVVAETGLTVETLKYVIDAGWNRAQESYQPSGAAGLITRPAPQSRIRQRKGRAGRLFPGEFYPLYTKNVFDALPPQQMADIVTEGVGPIILDIVLSQQVSKTLRAKPGAGSRELEFRVQDLDMLNAPPVDAFAAAVEKVTALGFFSREAPLFAGHHPESLAEREIDPEPAGKGFGLTMLGRVAAVFPRLTLCNRRLLMGASLWECSVSDLATMVAVITVCQGQGLASLLEKRARRAALQKASARFSALAPAFARGLPSYIAPAVLPPEKAADRGRLMLCDDILEGLCIFEAYRTRLAIAVQGEEMLTEMAAWCEGMSLDPAAMLDLAEAREAALEEMVVAGLNPFWGEGKRLVKASPANFIPQVQRLKRCLYDAYRLNELVRDEGGDFVSRFGHHVSRVVLPTGALSRPAPRPVHVITPSIAIVGCTQAGGGAEKHPPLRWELAAPLVSVLTTPYSEASVAPNPRLLEPARPASAETD